MTYVLPLAEFKITRGGEFGARRDAGPHRGVDGRAAVGTVCYAVIGGVVVRTGYTSTYGNFIVWRGDDGFFWAFAHLKSSVDIPVGRRFETRTPLVLSGATGNVDGAHLHVGVGRSSQIGVSTFDPMTLLKYATDPTKTTVNATTPHTPEEDEMNVPGIFPRNTETGDIYWEREPGAPLYKLSAVEYRDWLKSPEYLDLSGAQINAWTQKNGVAATLSEAHAQRPMASDAGAEATARAVANELDRRARERLSL